MPAITLSLPPRRRYTAVGLKRQYISAARQLAKLAAATAAADPAPESASVNAAALLDSMGGALTELIGLVPAGVVDLVRRYEQRTRAAVAGDTGGSGGGSGGGGDGGGEGGGGGDGDSSPSVE